MMISLLVVSQLASVQDCYSCGTSLVNNPLMFADQGYYSNELGLQCCCRDMNMNAFLSSSVQWNPDSPVQQNAEFSADEKASFCDHDNLSLLEETPLCCCQETIFYDQSIAEFSTDEMTCLYHYANPSLSVCSRAGARCTNTIISMLWD